MGVRPNTAHRIGDAQKGFTVEDLMSKTSYGQVALRKFGTVPKGFEIFSAGWLGKKPEDWKTMRVTGAQFKGKKRIPHTTMTTIVTVAEMEAIEVTGSQHDDR